MRKIRRFEDIESWQLARELVRSVYQECKLGELAKDYDTKSQLKRATLSIMNNIAEGFARRSKKEFIRFLDISVSSVAEVKSIMYVLEDVNYLDTDKAKEYRRKTDSIRNLILGLIRYLNSQPQAYVKDDQDDYGVNLHLSSDN